MSAYTPGPWESLDGGEIGEIFVDSDEGPVADLVKPERGGSKRVEANARLIAAAPDLLAALKGFVQPAGQYSGDLEAAAIAAIEKAEGAA